VILCQYERTLEDGWVHNKTLSICIKHNKRSEWDSSPIDYNKLIPWKENRMVKDLEF
jgi:hypothetical protein